MTSQEQELLTRVARAICVAESMNPNNWPHKVKAARAAIEAIMRAADEVPYDSHGAEVTTLHHWFAGHYSPAEWMDDGCRSENARDLLNTLSKAGFIIVPTSLFRLPATPSEAYGPGETTK